MSDKSTDLVPYPTRSAQVSVVNKQENKPKVDERVVEATADIVRLLVRGGNVFLDVKRMQAESAGEWEATHRRIAELDSSTESELRKLAALLDHQKEKTLRLRLVLDVIASKGETLPDVYGRGLALAVEQLTRE